MPCKPIQRSVDEFDGSRSPGILRHRAFHGATGQSAASAAGTGNAYRKNREHMTRLPNVA